VLTEVFIRISIILLILWLRNSFILIEIMPNNKIIDNTVHLDFYLAYLLFCKRLKTVF